MKILLIQSLNDNPHALNTRPDWIHLIPMPNPLRGKYLYTTDLELSEQAEISKLYVKYLDEKIEYLQSKNRIPACFIAEPLSGNAGGVELPFNYLFLIYNKIRQVGGLCISDEVQVGYGRLGKYFWGFEEHNVIPDIITMAKAAGNGHPIGYIITSHDNAKIFGLENGSFFSSAGGNPVSCTIGSTILDIIKFEKLQQNAMEVGTYLNKGLKSLAVKYPHIIGCIHGHGLYQGIELVRNTPFLLTPSTDTSSTSTDTSHTIPVSSTTTYSTEPPTTSSSVSNNTTTTTTISSTITVAHHNSTNTCGDSNNNTSTTTPTTSTTTTTANKIPATEEAYAICERLLSLGVICHNTGDYSNVLKVKPPLCFTYKDADYFIQALEIALQGW